MRRLEDNCVGCAECIGCGRREQKYMAVICDRCREEIDVEYIRLNGKDYCSECFISFAVDALNAKIMEVDDE